MPSSSTAATTQSTQDQSFQNFKLDPSLLRGVRDMGYTVPTPIQASAIPPAVRGRDVLACAETGSGKTAAFVLPVLHRLLTHRGRGTRALVLTPTRELAAQVVEQFQQLGKHTQIRAAAIYGGVSMGPQEQAFRRGTDVIVACPGRLLDHLSRPYGHLRDIDVLVLDEVDRMLDMGFLPDVRRILRQIPELGQVLCYSATMPREIADLCDDLMHEPVRLEVERVAKPAAAISQRLIQVHESDKRDAMLQLLQGAEIFNALVFTRTKHRANRLADWLTKRGVVAERIHGNRTQGQRTRALDAFRRGKARVLVATDVAARGIDVDDLSHVINFDVPNMPEDYIHRVGRTGRAQREGDAITFVTPADEDAIRAIERAVGEAIPRQDLDGNTVQAPKQASRPAPKQSRGRGQTSNNGSSRRTRSQGNRGTSSTPRSSSRSAHDVRSGAQEQRQGSKPGTKSRSRQGSKAGATQGGSRNGSGSTSRGQQSAESGSGQKNWYDAKSGRGKQGNRRDRSRAAAGRPR